MLRNLHVLQDDVAFGLTSMKPEQEMLRNKAPLGLIVQTDAPQ